ncbi:DUF2637 domain-containing protein [Actinacidiphila sp. ITFR-21]|uniref:DUF2637 domain-containing protein n=1 Tax=Actinacidiphila sp. ITFR-21 TaxID=3075199 RepID=UPI00288C50FB|nr:DUF2637 domain-containing protein [Streptomyces sp. ITFR-21]WNI14726.1 DUF2637 domain-containing protein [Streptomyces sp. ITFR-21]
MYEFPSQQGVADNDFLTAPYPGPWHGHATVYETMEEPGSFPPGPDGMNGVLQSDAELRQFLEASMSHEATAGLALHIDTGDVPLSRRRHRKARAEPQRWKPTRGEALSFSMLVMSVGIMAVVSVLGGTVTHDPLRRFAGAQTPGGLACWWPLLVYGPWTAASLSIVRAALYQRRALHAWAVVLAFSAFAIVFCVVQTPRTFTGVSVVSLPTIATLACFQQLIRQITLTKPPVPRATGAHRGRIGPPRAPSHGGAPPYRPPGA